MYERSTYTECELKHIDEGHDPARAAEMCAHAGGRASDEETGTASQGEGWDEYWGET